MIRATGASSISTLHLDESRVGDRALKVILGNQGVAADVCEHRDRHGWEAPGAVDVEMQPGDVLLHDGMVVYGSERAQGRKLRRTICYEFRAAEETVAESLWDWDWLERRMRVLPLRRHQEAPPTRLSSTGRCLTGSGPCGRATSRRN